MNRLAGWVVSRMWIVVTCFAMFGLGACANAPSPAPTSPPAPTAAAQPSTAPTNVAATAAPTAAPQATATPTAPPPTPTEAAQSLVITSPPAGTLVGSPVVITGQVGRTPTSGRLSYRFTDSGGQQIGAGEFAVQGNAFNSSLDFNLPPQGGDVSVEVFDRDAAGNVNARATLALFIAPPQAITFTSPAAGTFIGSPMVVTGNLARLPYQSNLGYVFTDNQGRQIGAGIIPVQGQPGRPTSFRGSLPLNLPLLGGDIQLRVYDQNAADNAVVAEATLPLKVVPQPQQLIFTSPAPNTYVGSPIVITGRTVRYPAQGSLGYRITDSNGVQLGAGAFPVTGAPGQGSTWSAELGFNLPPQGGPVQITISDQNANTGVIIANATLTVQVVPARQAITIETPAQFTQVGSPVVLTGRTARYPNGGQLRYNVRDDRGNVLGTGTFPVNGPINLPATFNPSISFNFPSFGGNVIFDLSDVDPFNGAVLASASVTLRVAPPPEPPQPVPQQIFIDTPASGTAVGSPVTITGRTARAPSGGFLRYRMRDPNNQEVAAGSVTVTNNTFVAAISFQRPTYGGPVFVEFFDVDAVNGTVGGSATILLQT